jgi:outer membrane protein OmpA-like peptidoglycan-associated protein
MRHRDVVVGLALFSMIAAAPAIGLAEGVPSSADIVKSLTPSAGSGATRGLRITPNAPGQSAAPSPSPSHAATTPAAAAPSINLSVLFATNSADLTPQAVAVLDNLGKALNDQALAHDRFRIEGHTDTVGTREHNLELSNRRAAVVVDYLANNFHIDRSRIEAIGMGEDQLLIHTPDQTPEARNRRVHVVNLGG